MPHPEQPDTYQIFWHDASETILRCNVLTHWTWGDAYECLSSVNQQVAEKVSLHPVYVIISLADNAGLIPKGGSAITNIRNLLRDDPSHEELTIFVARGTMLSTMINIASRVYGLIASTSKIKFATSLEEAIELIQHHKERARIKNDAL